VRNLFVAVLALMVCCGSAWAQVSASISGRVEDSSGAAVSGATVTVKNVETGAIRTSTTDDTGNFRILSLNVGPQEVKAEKSGFKTAVRSGVNLVVGQEALVNLQLEIGEVTQIVSVIEEAPLVNATTASISGLVSEREVKELPLSGRSFDNLITLNPGAINFGLKSAQTSTSNGNTFSVAGRRPMENLLLWNGVEYTGSSQLSVTPGGVSGYLLGIDAVREFNVLTDSYSAEYGKRAGAQVSVVTQSGSNTLHGSIFEFLRNSALDAPGIFDQGVVPPFQRNQFGGSLGGPLKKDKLFLFGNYEGFRQRLAVSNVSVVPDQQARLGQLPNASGVYTPVANVNQNMLPYMSFWPAANGAELTVNGLPTGTALSYNNPKQSIDEDFATFRADYTLTPRDSFSASYTIDDGDGLIPLADPLFGSRNRLRTQVASLQETHIVSSDLLNTFRMGFSRAAFTYDSFPLAKFDPKLSFVSGGGPGGIVIGGGTTTTGVAAITAAGPNNAANVWNRRNLFTWSDNVQWSRGRHQISSGVWLQRIQDNENTASRRLGQASFASLTTFLQGTATTFQIVPNPTALNWRSFFGAWFVEDSMKLRPNLTFRLGLRHEFTTGWNEAHNRAANYVTDAAGVLQTDPLIGSATYTKNNARRLFSPRVGLAWSPFGDGKTAIRAGFGTYYTLIDSLAFLLNSLPPYNGSVSFANVSLPSILPIVPTVPVPPSCGTGVPTPCTTYAPQGIQKDAKTPTVQEWNLTVEQQITRDTALRLAYVGSFGYHGLLSLDPNTVPAQICSSASPTACQTGGTGTARGVVNPGVEYIPVASRPNPNVAAGFFWFTEGNSSYNALQSELVRRLSDGLQFRINYTWSKNLDINSALTGAQANNQAQMVMNRNDIHRDWGPSALNAEHQSSISARYELPFARNNRVFGGWQVNGIVSLLSGFPVTPQVGSNRSGDGNTRNPDRPSLNPAFSGNVLLQKQTQWFDPNAFVLPAVGTFGNLGRGTLTGPGLATVDTSFFKDTTIKEKVTAQFRVEVFNLLNRANLGTPNAIVFSSGAINPSAGLITTTATMPRQVQFGLKLIF
jgi:hypothetical protein